MIESRFSRYSYGIIKVPVAPAAVLKDLKAAEETWKEFPIEWLLEKARLGYLIRELARSAF